MIKDKNSDMVLSQERCTEEYPLTSVTLASFPGGVTSTVEDIACNLLSEVGGPAVCVMCWLLSLDT
jgi:hypothetical protein